MSVAFTPLPAGTMTRATVLANYDLLRAWMNGGVVTGDITAASVRAQHIFRPDSYGFPLLAQHRASARETAGRANVRDANLLYKAIHRLDLYPSALNNDGAVRCTPDLGITFDHWGPESYVVVNAVWDAVAVPAYPALYAIYYQGYFQLCYRDRSTGIRTVVANSKRQVQSQNALGNNPVQQYSTQARFLVTEGSYDVWVEWVKDENVTAAVVVGLNSITMRTHRTQ